MDGMWDLAAALAWRRAPAEARGTVLGRLEDHLFRICWVHSSRHRMRSSHSQVQNVLWFEAGNHDSGVLSPRSEISQACFSFILEDVGLLLVASGGIQLDEPRRAMRVPRLSEDPKEAGKPRRQHC